MKEKQKETLNEFEELKMASGENKMASECKEMTSECKEMIHYNENNKYKKKIIWI